MGELRLRRRFDIQTNSIAIAPSGGFVAYFDRGVVIDDGRRRLFRGTAKRLTRSSNEIIRGAVDDAVIISDTRHLSVVGLDAERIDLLPCERHLALSLDNEHSTLTALLGARLLQFDTSTWKLRRMIDLSTELDITHYTTCVATPDWMIVGTSARFVVLDGDGQVETILPGGGRHRPAVFGDLLVMERHPNTVVSSLPSDDAVATWVGESNATWCAMAAELRGVSGADVVARTSVDDEPKRFALASDEVAPTRTNYVVFAEQARVVARWFLHSKTFDVFEW